MVDSQQVACSEVQFDEAFGSIVERRRRARGISTQQLAARCGVTISDIDRIECGCRAVSIHELIQLTWALETPPHVLFREVRHLLCLAVISPEAVQQ